jgi:hypothetical protein
MADGQESHQHGKERSVRHPDEDHADGHANHHKKRNEEANQARLTRLRIRTSPEVAFCPLSEALPFHTRYMPDCGLSSPRLTTESIGTEMSGSVRSRSPGSETGSGRGLSGRFNPRHPPLTPVLFEIIPPFEFH